MSEAEPATYSAELQPERRRVPRIPFKTMSVVAERGSSRIVIAQTIDLSRFGCFVQTPEPYPQGTRVRVEMANDGATFTALGKVAYATGEGMGIVFSMVEPDNEAILEKWLAQ